MKRGLILCLFWLVLPFAAHAVTPQDEARAQRLFSEIRCVQCQSESIADSDAQIAGDMRQDIRDAISAGRSDAEIRQNLYEHYGDYVLFRPRLSKANLILWLLPPLVVFLGAFVFWRMSKRQGKTESSDLSEAERKKLRELMKNEP